MKYDTRKNPDKILVKQNQIFFDMFQTFPK